MTYRVLGDVELTCGQSVHKLLDVDEYGIVLILHMLLNLDGIVIIKFEYQERHVIHVVAVDCLDQFTAYGGQYEIAEIGMCTLEVLYKSRQRNRIAGIVLTGYQVCHCQECRAVYSVLTAYLIYGTVAESKVYSETAYYQKQQIVVINQVPHFVLRDVFRCFYAHF